MKKINYTDIVYGKIRIDTPVVEEIIQSEYFQRLKDVNQGGYLPLWKKLCNMEIDSFEYSRFTHSVGVYTLLKKYKVPIEEQLYGLIHDLSHTSFSHCIDYVMKEGSQKKHDYQDNSFHAYVNQTNIPEILEKYGYSTKKILDETNFSIAEKDLPDLCADRVDYSLREGLIYKEITEEEKNSILYNLEVINNDWVFKDFDVAKKYSKMFSNLNNKYYSGIKSASMFAVVSDCLKYALKHNYISIDDFYTTDTKLISKLEPFVEKDSHFKKLWERMHGHFSVKQDLNSRRIFCKSRVVDPLVLDDKEIKRFSDIETNWKKIVEKEIEPREYFLSILDTKEF